MGRYLDIIRREPTERPTDCEEAKEAKEAKERGCQPRLKTTRGASFA